MLPETQAFATYIGRPSEPGSFEALTQQHPHFGKRYRIAYQQHDKEVVLAIKGLPPGIVPMSDEEFRESQRAAATLQRYANMDELRGYWTGIEPVIVIG